MVQWQRTKQLAGKYCLWAASPFSGGTCGHVCDFDQLPTRQDLLQTLRGENSWEIMSELTSPDLSEVLLSVQKAHKRALSLKGRCNRIIL